MHYYQFNIADYRKDTIHLTPIEHYIYRTLIDWYYLDEQPIPKITQVVSRRLGLGSDMEPNIANVLKDFFVEHEDGWHHGRIDEEINEYHDQCDRNKTNGKLGGRPKKTQSVTSGNPELTESNPVVTLTTNHKPLTTNQEPNKTKNTVTATDDFSKFWEVYPKKTGKTEAQKSWLKNKPPIDLILKALVWQSRSEQWRKDNGQFVPNPSTYLNQGRWQDEPIQLTGTNVNESFNDQAREGARARLFGVQANETG